MTDQSEQSAESLSPEAPIDAESLLKAANEADAEGRWGNDGAFDPDALKIAEGAKEVTSGTRATDASGDVETKQDKAEPSAEQQKEQPKEHIGHPEAPKALERDEKGRFLPKDKQVQEAKPSETPAEKPETPYSKAKKEEERQKSLLANFEEDKKRARAEIEAEKQRLAQERAEIERFKQVPRRPDGSPHEFNSAQYAKAADDFYSRARKALSEGDVEQSNQLLAQAEQCSQAAEQVARVEQQVAQQEGFKQYWGVWQQNMDNVLAQEPELRDLENNPVAKEINNILADKDWGPILERIPNGFGVAAQIMKWKVQAEQTAAKDSALSEENQKLKAENADFRRRLQIRPAPTTGAMPRAKSPEEMPPDELRRYLQQAAAEEDRMPAFG